MLRKISELTLPKFQIITRWGTWISFMVEKGENYNKYKLILDDVVLKKPKSIDLWKFFMW